MLKAVTLIQGYVKYVYSSNENDRLHLTSGSGYADTFFSPTNEVMGAKVVYDLRFYPSGRILSASRRKLHETLMFHQINGSLKSFVVHDYQDGNFTGGYYETSWGDKGRFLREGHFGKVLSR
jgi:hypothetical protein